MRKSARFGTLAFVAVAAAAPLIAAAPAQAAVLGNPTGCHAWRESSSSGMGVCTATNGGKWRTGVSCTDGHYYYSQWTGYTDPRRARCGAGRLTPGIDPWIDTKET